MTKRNFLFIPLFSFLAIAGCTKDRTPSGIDAELFSKAKQKDLVDYFNNEYRESAKDTGHKSTYFRRKYNNLAKSIVDSSESINPNFLPEGSLIVYEMNSINKGEPEKYAIMFKDKIRVIEKFRIIFEPLA